MSTIRTFGIEYAKEIFHGYIVIRASGAEHKGLKALFFAQVEVRSGSVLRPLVTVEGVSSSDIFCDPESWIVCVTSDANMPLPMR